jgi:GTP-binding protein Era
LAEEVDGILWLVDARDGLRKDDDEIAERLKPLSATVIVLLNKIDLIAKGKLLPLIERCAQLLPGREIIPITALKGDGVEMVLDRIEKLLPEGPRYYTEGEITDQTERFLAAEIVREKVFLRTREEIPYGTAVTIDEFTEKEEKNLIVIKATIHVERETHKPILIGRRGAMLKEIGTEARTELEKILGCKIFLELFIRVDPGWTQDPNALNEMGL